MSFWIALSAPGQLQLAGENQKVPRREAAILRQAERE
jgi:hypothetical protein